MKIELQIHNMLPQVVEIGMKFTGNYFQFPKNLLGISSLFRNYIIHIS